MANGRGILADFLAFRWASLYRMRSFRFFSAIGSRFFLLRMARCWASSTMRALAAGERDDPSSLPSRSLFARHLDRPLQILPLAGTRVGPAAALALASTQGQRRLRGLHRVLKQVCGSLEQA